MYNSFNGHGISADWLKFMNNLRFSRIFARLFMRLSDRAE